MKQIILFIAIVFNQNLLAFGSDDIGDSIFSAISLAFNTPFETQSQITKAGGLLQPEVETKNGVVFGAALPEANAFFSVPYATSPIGKQRFLYSTPAVDYPNGKLDASVANGVACYQTSNDECDQGLCFNNLSEDCLVLNVYVPSGVNLSDRNSPPDDRLPVMLWLHGGGLLTGSGTSPLYDGRYLSNVTNTIVVTINYRLGAFGFLVFEENGVVYRNQGFKDQQMAMSWVQENIEKFGGDKSRVTLFGNSAGAQSVMFHLMSSTSEPLFQRGIIQSQPAIFQYPKIKNALNITQQVLKNTNCEPGGISCLREENPTALVRQGNRLRVNNIKEQDLFATVEPFGLVLDDEEFTQNPLQFVQSGHWQNDKQVIMGTNIDEMVFVPLYIPDKTVFNTKDGFEKTLSFAFGEKVGKMLADEYEKIKDDTMVEYDVLLGQLVTDGFFICPVRQLARLSSVLTTVYLYSYAYAMNDPSCKDAWKPRGVCGNVFHSAENSFVFRSAPLIPYNFSSDDIDAVNQFSIFWGNFAYTGNPSNGNVTSLGEVPEWPAYHSNEGQFQRHDDNVISQYASSWLNYVIDSPNGYFNNDYHKDICDFWDSTGYYIMLDDSDTTTTTRGAIAITTNNGVATGISDVTTMPQINNDVTTLEASMSTTGGRATIHQAYYLYNLLSALFVLINVVL